MLNKKQLWQLRQQCVLNSIFLKDYKNNMYIKEKDACAFFDSYIEYLYDEYAHDDDENIFNLLNEYDNAETLYAYYCYFDSDPLLQRDYIAIKTLNNYGGVGVLDINDSCVIYRHDYKTSYDNDISKIMRHKLYYGYKRQDYYFIDNNKRYYLSDFLRVE